MFRVDGNGVGTMSLSARSGGRTATRSDEGTRRVSDGEGEVPRAATPTSPARYRSHPLPPQAGGEGLRRLYPISSELQ